MNEKQQNESNQINDDEIFHREQKVFSTDESISWLRSNFFLADKRVLFGTWNGVFTSIILNIFGVLIYLRAGWIVANAGIILSLIIVLISFIISFITMSSAIGKTLVITKQKTHSGNLQSLYNFYYFKSS